MPSTVSLKSHPLQNFSSPVLKWAAATTTTTTGRTINHQSRRLSDSTHESTLEDSAFCSTASPSKNEQVSEKEKTTCDSVSRCANIGFSAPSCPLSDVLISKSENNSMVHHLVVGTSEEKPAAVDGRAKILLRFPWKSTMADDAAADIRHQTPVTVVPAAEAEESEVRTWNLRTRKLSSKILKSNGGAPELQGIKPQSTESPIQPASSSLGIFVSEPSKLTGKRKEKKRSFSISLTKEEIEDDVFAITGSKPTRRPKKRAKNVQRRLDSLFPGLWLDSIRPDSYRVRGKSTKR